MARACEECIVMQLGKACMKSTSGHVYRECIQGIKDTRSSHTVLSDGGMRSV